MLNWHYSKKVDQEGEEDDENPENRNSNPREKQRELVGSSMTVLGFSQSRMEQARGPWRQIPEDDNR